MNENGKVFTFCARVTIFANEIEEARNILQKRLDNGDLIPNDNEDWNLEKDQEYEFNHVSINKEIVFNSVHVSPACLDEMTKYIDIGASKDHYLDAHCIEQTDFGFRVFTYFDTEDELAPTGWPELDRLLAFAKLNGCKWLVLDCDGPEYEDWYKFDH